MTIAIEVQRVSRVFDQQDGRLGGIRRIVAVDDVSLQVAEGQVLGIVGESGCGKSTLARILLGLLAPTSGTVNIEGRTLAATDRRLRARLIQPVFQDPMSSLNPRRRIGAIVALPLLAAGKVDRRTIREQVATMLEQVGLASDIARRFPSQLSGGQRQRVALARALIARPRILVCDEPTSALDVSVQAQILNLLSELRVALGLTIVFISHNLAVVEHLADQLAVMYLGRIVEYDDAATIFRAPRHPYTRALLSAVLTPDPSLGLPLLPLGGEYPDPSDVPPGCRFHPRCPNVLEQCTRVPPARGAVECHLAIPVLSF